MPELPEVQTIANQLQKKIIGKKIKVVDIRLVKMIQGVSPKKFRETVQGVKIKNVSRRAKLLIINLSNDYSLLIHLKLSGQIIYKSNIRNQESEISKHTHVIYYFSDGSALFHKDIRQFGWVKLFKTTELEKYFQKENFGPEPLDKNFTLDRFKKLLLQKPKQRIKPLLMDQKFVAGIGNIYAQEASFCARVLPTRIIKDLKEKEIIDLYYCLIKILREAIKRHGSSVDDYLDTEGKKGDYVPRLKVYNRLAKNCYSCQGPVKKMTLAGRGTYFCPKCQK